MFARVLESLRALSPPLLLACLVGITLLIGYFDYLAGTDATFSAIYLFPIGAAAWLLGRPYAYGLAILSSILWVTGDVAAGARYASILIPLWNLAARFAIFVFAAEVIAQWRKLHDDLEARAAERAVKLTAEIAARERLQRELLQIIEREQRRVGHDIHDSLCQHLTGTAFAGQVLAQSLKAEQSAQAENAGRIVHLIQEGINLSRGLARGLNSVSLSGGGFREALEDFASSTSDLFKISCRVHCPVPISITDVETAGHLYRIVQEAVGNAIKHGRAKNILIRLDRTDAGTTLRVIDDGNGLPASLEGKGMGLRIMRYRADLISAAFAIRPRDAGGTVVTCTLPEDRELSGDDLPLSAFSRNGKCERSQC